MIAFLVLCYVAILATLVWLKVIKLNLWWKLSPLLFMLVCFFVLIFPLQWGAPSGTVNVYQYVIEIIPNVTGEVVDVPVEPMKPLKKGDVLFQIDRRPYQAKVKQLEAALAEAEQAVPQLEAALGTAKANLEHATAQRDLQKLELDRNESIRKKARAPLPNGRPIILANLCWQQRLPCGVRSPQKNKLALLLDPRSMARIPKWLNSRPNLRPPS